MPTAPPATLDYPGVELVRPDGGNGRMLTGTLGTVDGELKVLVHMADNTAFLIAPETFKKLLTQIAASMTDLEKRITGENVIPFKPRCKR